MNPLVYLISNVIGLYSFVVFCAVIVSILISFRILNTGNPLVYKVNEVLEKLTEPVLSKIRSKLPDLAGLDISPVILLLGLQVLNYTVVYYFG